MPGYVAPAQQPLVALAEVDARLNALPTGCRVRAVALQEAGRIVAAWVTARPEMQAATRTAARLVEAMDRHAATGRLAWRALRGGGAAGADPAAHAWTVAVEAVGLGHQLGLAAPARRGLALAGLVHDVGWTLMPDGEPNPGEHAQAAEHLLGLRGATGGLAAEAVRAHHERWDGRGGPLGLVGAEIPVLARALAVVDRADQARRSPAERPPVPAVILLAEAGGALDPALVRAWLALSARRDDGWSP